MELWGQLKLWMGPSGQLSAPEVPHDSVAKCSTAGHTREPGDPEARCSNSPSGKQAQ